MPVSRRIAPLPPAMKVDLLAQSFDLPRQVHNKLEADQIEPASGPQILDAAQNSNGLIVEIPATARGIHHRRHKSVFAINDYEAARQLSEARYRVERVYGTRVGFEDLQRGHRCFNRIANIFVISWKRWLVSLSISPGIAEDLVRLVNLLYSPCSFGSGTASNVS